MCTLQSCYCGRFVEFNMHTRRVTDHSYFKTVTGRLAEVGQILRLSWPQEDLGSSAHLELCRSAIEDEHEPEDLVEALHKDVQPHGSVDQGLCATVGGLQQQIWGWILGRQCCSAKQTVKMSSRSGDGSSVANAAAQSKLIKCLAADLGMDPRSPMLQCKANSQNV